MVSWGWGEYTRKDKLGRCSGFAGELVFLLTGEQRVLLVFQGWSCSAEIG